MGSMVLHEHGNSDGENASGDELSHFTLELQFLY